MRRVFIIPFLFVFFQCRAKEIILEPLVIERSRYSLSLQDTDFFPLGPEQPYPSFSPEEVLGYSSSIELRKRSAFGIQQDVSLRGSIFEDTSVILHGVKINDPQTGHFSLQLPLTSADLERADILKNSQILHFRLKKPRGEGGLAGFSFGQHALRQQLLSVNFPAVFARHRVSAEHARSSGYRQDTDFENYRFSWHSFWEGAGSWAEFFFGSLKKDFGAGNFYTSRFPHQEEHTAQQFYLLKGAVELGQAEKTASLYLRRHTDKFILDRYNPDFYTNHHTTYVYGLQSSLDFYNGLFVSAELANDKIKSTNLNRHNRPRKGFSAGIKEKKIGKFIFDLSAGIDHYRRLGVFERGRFALGYTLSDSSALRFSFDRIFRTPSFTELFYQDPANEGNSSLGMQHSNNYELGVDFRPSAAFSASAGVFLRDQSSTIDWVKDFEADPWQAKNVGDLKVRGLDLYGRLSFDRHSKDRANGAGNRYLFRFSELSLGYTYLDLDRGNPFNFSKYVFDYSRHKLVGGVGVDAAKFTCNLFINFSQSPARPSHATVDLKALRRIGDFSLSVEGINIFNKSYFELQDIPAAGRWYRAGLTYHF